MAGPVVNLDELQFIDFGHGASHPGAGEAPERFQARIGQIADRVGARDLGYNLTVVPAGKTAFPFHWHTAVEEMFFVVSGRGEIRIGDQRHALRAGDVVACPTGGPATAHQIINTGDEELRYLGVSTRRDAEVCGYPDSGKIALMAKTGTDARGRPEVMRFASRPDLGLTYWDGE